MKFQVKGQFLKGQIMAFDCICLEKKCPVIMLALTDLCCLVRANTVTKQLHLYIQSENNVETKWTIIMEKRRQARLT